VVSGLVSELRDLALRLDSPVLVISSQNRPGQGSASLVSLKESGDLEYSADTAMFLVEADKRTVAAPSRAVDLVIEKNRYGDKGRIELIFKPQLGQFREELPYGY
jgi:replicative DNA helicase